VAALPLLAPSSNSTSNALSYQDLSRQSIERQIQERAASGKYGRLVTADISAGLEQVRCIAFLLLRIPNNRQDVCACVDFVAAAAGPLGKSRCRVSQF
jgi:hypothetical protein